MGTESVDNTPASDQCVLQHVRNTDKAKIPSVIREQIKGISKTRGEFDGRGLNLRRAFHVMRTRGASNSSSLDILRYRAIFSWRDIFISS